MTYPAVPSPPASAPPPARRWRAASRPGRLEWRSAPITLLLVAVNVGLFLASGMGRNPVLDRWGLVPYDVAHGQLYRLFTSPFFHISVAHVGLNMASLVFVGIPVEAALGRVRFAALYAASAAGGSVLYYLIAPLNSLAVGASGAIFGVLGAYFVLARRRGLPTGTILAVIAINLAYGFAVPGIGWQAHIGGLAAGLVMAVGFAAAERRRRPVRLGVEMATAGTVAVALLVLMQLSPSGHIVY
jgi:membrane associated rhomboid family serine protease